MPIARGSPGERGGQHLVDRVLDLIAGLADLQLLTETEDRDEAVLVRGGGLGGQVRVGLVVIVAALGVADQHVRAAQLRQERAGDLAGVSTGIVRRQVLRTVGRPSLSASTRVCALRRAVNGGNTATSTCSRYLSGRVNAIFWTSAMASKWLRLIFQLPAIRGLRGPCLVPFLGASRTAIPGSSLPSRNSGEAPPPVEMWVKPSVGNAEQADRRGRIAAADHSERPWPTRG